MKTRRIIAGWVIALSMAAATLVAVDQGSAFAQAGPAVTVDPTGTFDPSGSATLTGTFSCGDNTGFAFVDVVLSQSVGRVSTVSGEAFADIPSCAPGVSGTWTATISPSNGKFRGGAASASARLVVDTSAVAEIAASVRLHR